MHRIDFKYLLVFCCWSNDKDHLVLDHVLAELNYIFDVFVLLWQGNSFYLNQFSKHDLNEIHSEPSPFSLRILALLQSSLTNPGFSWCKLASDCLFPKTITIGVCSLTGLFPENIQSEEWLKYITETEFE